MIDAGMLGAHRELEARLRPFVARRLSGAAEVDDVLQEVFLRVQRGLPHLRQEERFGAWIYQVARSAIADHRRDRARHPVLQTELSEEPAAEADEDEGAAERELATYVAPFIALLPAPYREALTLTELDGLTQKEAADRMGVSLSGMKSRVQRGRERLRKLFEDCCDIALDPRGRVMGCEPRKNGAGPGCRCD